jgi:acyl carrier protein
MQNPPSIDSLAEKIRELAVQTVGDSREVDLGSPLAATLGFDSLDLIEIGFALEEFFGFEFSGRNPIEELHARLGGRIVLDDSTLTPLGRTVLFERMPELADVDLPASLRAGELPQYFNILTYARLVKDFYDHTPDECPLSGQQVVLDDFRLVTADTSDPVKAPTGDEILEAWIESKLRTLRKD